MRDVSKDLLLAIDFQNVYLPGNDWACPGSVDAITNTLRILNAKNAPDALITKYLAPEHPVGRWINYNQEYKDINSLFSVAQMAGHFAIVFGMIVVVSADLGSASILLFVFLIMFFCLGVKLYWFALGGAAVAAMIPILWTYFLKPYQKKRLLSPYDPSIDPDGWGISWQTTQSKLTLASGRMTGVDAEHTRTVFTGKHTDFIFSTTGETLGMIGCLVIIILLIVIILHVAKVGLSCGRTYDMLICMGIAGAMAAQMFINIGMCIGITPVIGITLPFFSYGGSSMVTMYAAAGIVSGVKFKLKPQHSVLA